MKRGKDGAGSVLAQRVLHATCGRFPTQPSALSRSYSSAYKYMSSPQFPKEDVWTRRHETQRNEAPTPGSQ